MMKHRYITVAALLVFASCSANRISPAFKGPAPLAVLIEENPWLWVIGSDVPSVALYDDGLLIYHDATITNDFPFRSVRLQTQELRELCESIGPTEEFDKLHPCFDLAGGFDLPSTKLYLSDGKTHKMVSLYGTRIDDGHLLVCDNNTNIVAPKEFIRVQTLLSGLSYKGADPWIPEYYEIMIWPYDYAPNQRNWPDTFPGLKDRLTLQRKKGAYSLYIQGSRKAELAEFLSKSRDKEAVVIDGKKWAVSVRPVFPNEPVWRAAEKEYGDVIPKGNGI